VRIVLTVPSLAREFGGPVVKVHGLAAGLRDLGCEVVVVGGGSVTDDTDFTNAIALGRRGGFHATPIPRRTGALRSAVRGCDVVHVVGYRDPVGTLAARSAFRSQRPFVVEPAGMHRRRVRSMRMKSVFDTVIGNRLLHRAARVMATSALEADELVADGVARSRIAIRPNGIHVDPAPPERGRDFRAEYGIPLDAPLVISIGRITKKKGLVELVRATADLPGVWTLIAGPDDGDGALRAVRAEAAGRTDVVVLSDGLWDAQRAAALAAADVFCLPSATENFGTAAVEAAASGVPLVVSDEVGGVEHVAGRAVEIVRHGDESALRAALLLTLGDADRRAAAEREAPALRMRLAWVEVARRQLAIYEDVVG